MHRMLLPAHSKSCVDYQRSWSNWSIANVARSDVHQQ